MNCHYNQRQSISLLKIKMDFRQDSLRNLDTSKFGLNHLSMDLVTF